MSALASPMMCEDRVESLCFQDSLSPAIPALLPILCSILVPLDPLQLIHLCSLYTLCYVFSCIVDSSYHQALIQDQCTNMRCHLWFQSWEISRCLQADWISSVAAESVLSVSHLISLWQTLSHCAGADSAEPNKKSSMNISPWISLHQDDEGPEGGNKASAGRGLTLGRTLQLLQKDS